MKLTDIEIHERLLDLAAWGITEGKLQREFTFSDFKQAFLFMTRVAQIADELDHHPEWSNVYNKVNIKLTTHDVGGLSELDFRMARKINDL